MAEQKQTKTNPIAEISMRLILDENSNEKLEIVTLGGTDGLEALTNKLISTEDPYMLTKGTLLTMSAIIESYMQSTSTKKKRKPRKSKVESTVE